MAKAPVSSALPGSEERNEQAVHAALRLPTQPKSLGFQIHFGLANAVIGFTNITLYTILLPARIASFITSQQQQLNAFIVLTALGAIAAVITNPLAGALSDRTTLAMGRRRPWLIVATVLLMISIIMLALAPSIVILGMGSVLLLVAVNVLLAALTPILSDQIPIAQRAQVSAFSGMSTLFGGAVGQILVARVIIDTERSFFTLAIISAIVLISFTLLLREIPLPKGVIPAFRPKDLLASFHFSPTKYPDFAYTWGAKCLFFLQFTSFINYMLYFLRDEVHYQQLFPGQNPAQGVQILYLTLTICLMIASVIGGILSDRIQRRKPFVIGANLIATIGLLILTFFPTWIAVVIATAIIGIGAGSYFSADLALASQVVPTEEDRGKYLGIFSTAIYLPMLAAPIVVGIALNAFHTYRVLYGILAVITAISSLLVMRIKKVR